MNLKAMFEDQRAFNQLIFNARGDERSLIERIRNLSLGVIEETLEFLKTYEFKVHRRSKLRLQNVAHSHEELIDVYKYWLSLCDITDFPMERLEELYYAKSRVVQYRYQEEWIKTVAGPSVIVDIDQVLGNYIAGICKWGREWGASLMKLDNVAARRLVERLDAIEAAGTWVNADTVGVPHLAWQQVKHDFRTRGGKRSLPVFPDAKPFLEWCRSKGWTIILITSRPIVEYPNLFTDTLAWLEQCGLPFDHVWWATEKGERLEESHVVMRSQIVFAVDDSERFVEQFRAKGIRTYLLNRSLAYDDTDPVSDPYRVRSLHDLMARETNLRERAVDRLVNSSTEYP